ncbi:MAG: hypothetical protein LBV06_11225 [Propionibacteriaceae bacterium]|jgi:hypothetical protein|nr:hypothetical protein [Propionibacteriaceae bacterium]
MEAEVRLWAVSVDSFRQCFAAPPELASQLLALTDQAISTPPHRPKGLLGMLGPLTRHPPQGRVIVPGVPNRQDAEAMMTSRFIASDRLSACWVLAGIWLDWLATAHTTIALPVDRVDEMEFDLVRQNVPTELSIRHLWQVRLDIPLRATPTLSVGFLPHAKIDHLSQAWSAAEPVLTEQTKAFTSTVLAFISALPDRDARSNQARPDQVDQAPSDPPDPLGDAHVSTATAPVDLIAWWLT